MNRTAVTITVKTDMEMMALGRRLSAFMGVGKTIALYGQIGAGKSTLARALIQNLLAVPEDIPSPTFTIVQTYTASGFDIWHADLYRLSALDQVDELGLWDAFHADACIIEWPEVLGEYLPDSAMKIDIEVIAETARSVTISAPEDDWPDWKNALHDTH